MIFALKNNGSAMRYSRGEQGVFHILPKNGKPVSSKTIAEKFYSDEIPFNGRKIIISHLNSLARKLVLNNESFRLANSKRAGPHAMEFWLEKK